MIYMTPLVPHPSVLRIARKYPEPVSGGGGIRTHGDLMATTVFETVRFVHSRTPPGCMNYCVDRAILADQLAGKVRA